MKTVSHLFLLLAATVMAAAVSAQGTGGIRVNGVTIPQQRVDFFVRALVAQGRPDTPELRESVRQELIDRELLAQEAARRGLHKNPDVANEMEVVRQSVLIRAVVQDAARATPVTDESTRKEYERIKRELGTREYKARHILVEKEDEAKDIIGQIRKGASFEKLASERSKDPGSRARGGELDWGGADNYVKPFSDALSKLKKGQMTETPVQTQFGWHVIRLDDERPRKVPSYDEVKGNLAQQMQQNAQKLAVDKLLTELRAKAKIE
jgi:peptidyl-prolyl cis-trans isomerase C